jgi:dihydroorotate dehydrogenase (NAD+) catalytic subunit
MIELAPTNKRGLALAGPLIAGSGAVGYADAWPPGITPGLFSAIVTPPVSWRPRRGQAAPRLAETSAGFVLATGDHNPGYRRVIDDHATDWQRLRLPIILALAGRAPEEWDRLAAFVEEEPAVAGLELHVREGARAADVNNWVGAVRRATTSPVLVRLPSAQAAALAPAAAHAGAEALVIGAGPLAAVPAAGGEILRGPIAGPAAFPFTLHGVLAVAALGLGLPLVAAGGITRLADATLCLAAGACAVQVRSLVWTDPAAALRLAAALAVS